jgi:hypothetical protein
MNRIFETLNGGCAESTGYTLASLAFGETSR